MQLIPYVLVHAAFGHLSIVFPSNSYVIKIKNKQVNIFQNLVCKNLVTPLNSNVYF